MAHRASLVAWLLLAAVLALCAVPRCAAVKTMKIDVCPTQCAVRYADQAKGTKPSLTLLSTTAKNPSTPKECASACKAKKAAYYFFTKGSSGKTKICNCYTTCAKGLAKDTSSKGRVGGVAGSIAKC